MRRNRLMFFGGAALLLAGLAAISAPSQKMRWADVEKLSLFPAGSSSTDFLFNTNTIRTAGKLFDYQNHGVSKASLSQAGLLTLATVLPESSGGSGAGSLTCTNQFLTSNGTLYSCVSDTLASAQHANQGTTTTLLHGNAAGSPSWAGVSLTADTTANQGTATTLLHGNAAGQPSFAAVVDGDITPAYSGVAACSAGSFASTLARNTAPTCTSPAGNTYTWTNTQTFTAGIINNGQLVIGGRRTVADANDSPSGGGAYAVIEYTSLTAARTVTLPTSSVTTDQWFVIKDSSGNASATLTISVVGASGNVDGSAGAKVAIASAYGSAKFYWNGTQWLSASVLPKAVEVATFVPGLWTATQVLMRTAFTQPTVIKSTLPNLGTWAGTTATGSTVVTLTKRTQANSTSSVGTLTWAAGARNPTVSVAADVSFAAGDMLEAVGPASPDATLKDVTINIQAWR